MILGISAFFHDSAAALVHGGRVVAAAQEERFSRIKHDRAFPARAIEYCLAEAGLNGRPPDYVVFYEKPFAKFDRILETQLAVAPRGFATFRRAIPGWLEEKLRLPGILREQLPHYKKRPLFTSHHESHAASAFFPSPFSEAAVLTIDGVGEWATATIHHGQGNQLTCLAEQHFPHSLGLLYSAITHFCGFRVNSGEYKLMGLAPFGRPIHEEWLRNEVAILGDDGSLWLDQRWFNYCGGLVMTSPLMNQHLGGPPRRPEAPITRREMDLAASVQRITEDAVIRMARHARKLTGADNLCLAGGVALNCVANGRLQREGIFHNIWIQPAAGDAGGALGAALMVSHALLNQARPAGDGMSGGLLGPSIDPLTLASTLDEMGVTHRALDLEDLLEEACTMLEAGMVVGWVQGRMEYGPRALGARSILADPRHPGMQGLLNRKIKFRESFRPFAPAVLAEEAARWFDIPDDLRSPYMLHVAKIRESFRTGGTLPDDDASADEILTAISEVRSPFPAITHVDWSARLQTVEKDTGIFRLLLERFFKRTHCPMLANTSFNIRNEPIVLNAADAVRCFLHTEMDALIIGNHVILKADNPGKSTLERQNHLASFAAD